MNRQHSLRQKIVREYLLHIEDAQTRLLCHLLSEGYSNDTILRRLKITWPQLRALKAKIAGELLEAGVELVN